MDDALAIALDYAKSHYEGFNTTIDMTLDKAELLDHGDGGVEYYFTWYEIISGIYTRNYAVVFVNAENGAINNYQDNHELLRVDLNASISRDQAIRIAENTDHFKGYTPGKVDARLSAGYAGRQRLVWIIEIICYFNATAAEDYTSGDHHRGGEVIVDAKTGDVVRVNPCL